LPSGYGLGPELSSSSSQPPGLQLLGRACKDFVKPGSSCGSNNFLPPGLEDRCDFQDATCVDFSSCTGIQGPLGRCVAFEGACTSSAECDGPESYCNSSAGQCMAKRRLNDCCNVVAAPCEADLICLEEKQEGFDGPIAVATCQRPPVPPIGEPIVVAVCEDDNDCPRSQWCSDEFLGGGFGLPGQGEGTGATTICKDYVAVGAECRSSNTIPPQPEARCHHAQGVEFVPYTSCFETMTDPLSRCVAFGAPCGDDQDCTKENSYCALSYFCMAKFQRGDCSDALTPHGPLRITF
jgi:hypothetical protein